jgi:hypothetical protein
MRTPSALRRAALPESLSQGVTRSWATRRPALTLDHVWLAAVLWFAFLAGVLVDATGMDYWWTVKLGERLWATGQLPTADWLSFTASREPYVEQQWLAQAVLALVHQAGGPPLALLLRGIALALVTGGLFRACRRQGAPAWAAAWACALAVPLIVGGAAIRPQLLALPLFTFFLLGTTVWCGRAWTLAALPLAMALWANLHGSFPLGIALVGIALAGRGWEVRGSWRGDETLRRLALLLALCLLAPLANPYGPGLVSWLVDYMMFNNGGQGLPALAQEWQPTSLAALHGRLFFLSAIVLAIVLVRVGPPSPADSLRLLVFGVLALQAVRSTAWWALVWVPVLAWGLSRLPWPGHGAGASSTESRRGVPALNALLIGGLLVLAVLGLPWLRPRGLLYSPERWPITDPKDPVAVAEFVATLPAARLYNDLNWGGYLGWRLAPRQRVFVDARYQLYTPHLFRDYFAIAGARPGWADLLAAYKIDALVVSRTTQAPLLAAAEADGSWRAVYCDAEAAVYVPRAVAGDRAVPCGPVDPSPVLGLR